mmetsp:Transcript_16475/g.33869  ORF Transcript_16475/g.33869 Transcript_16475/m.33869 type:complete len:166 (+) Transcript_16475:138-635(+)|eukprot:CAMPEP_0201119700 /NCGR_PEP_ID=MMETSP0850-20130426/3818_1 /ASSEMBLY_ACC=CAM_ASM_000622 /TAXON_ID=183588 /ORGANISM="Pseudo-nitzschia fraudulenta, Strain WWA7" /LENGTH=165 /DNA_ID=CAMNT_0047385531 /DNA_START=144 /DNA_END=641 /DNA_ORIENTATION=+
MEGIEFAASMMNSAIDAPTNYFKDNAVAIAILLSIVYYFRTRRRTPQGYVLSSSSSSSSVDSGQKGQNGANDSHRDEMRRVRQRQQEIANERAKEAAKERKKKEAEEKERKNQIAKSKKPESGGSRLGDGSSTNSSAERRNDRNPLQPLASHTSSYRPARRNPRA